MYVTLTFDLDHQGRPWGHPILFLAIFFRWNTFLTIIVVTYEEQISDPTCAWILILTLSFHIREIICNDELPGLHNLVLASIVTNISSKKSKDNSDISMVFTVKLHVVIFKNLWLCHLCTVQIPSI